MWRQVKLKEKQNVIEYALRNVSAKKHKQIKVCNSLKGIIFVKKHILPFFSSIAKLTKKKKSFLKFSFFEGTPRPKLKKTILQKKL